MTFLASLNPQQREAVEHADGPLLVVAGAGSGKTRVVVCRIAWLILERGVQPQAILGVTFTNKAAGEMRARVGRLLEENGHPAGAAPLVSTFHSFCARLLRRYGNRLGEVREGLGPGFSILGNSDQVAIVKAALKEIGADAGDLKPRRVLGAISRAKNLGGAGDAVELHGADSAESGILNRVYKLYRESLVAANALDFDDLLLEAVRLLRSFPEIREALQDRYRHLLVDEFQDTNRPQYELVRMLAGTRRNVCVVGDQDQAIYSWRGADIGNILGFEQDFPAARRIHLEQNYRSSGNILKAATAVVANNTQRKAKRLWTDGPEGDRPVLLRSSDAHAEARAVVHHIEGLLDADPQMRVGVLYRTNAQSRLIEQALRQAGRQFAVVGGPAFYERAEVKNLLAYLRAALSPGDAVSLQRILNVPARGIGRSTLGRLQEIASRGDLTLWQAIGQAVDLQLVAPRARAALDRFRKLMARLRRTAASGNLRFTLERIFEETGYRQMLESDESPESRSRLENIRELIIAAQESADCGESLEDFLDQAALVADSDGIDTGARILLLTLHVAKGLEFPAVAMVGMEETLLPHRRSLGAGDDALEEERRLCYVGMTRARRHLILSHAASRRLYPRSPAEEMLPSRFLGEIPADLLDDRSPWQRRVEAEKAVHRTATVRATSMETHNSVSAVAGFFKERGIHVEMEPAPAGRRAQARPVRTQPPRGAPRLGRALRDLRRQGPFASGTRVRHSKFGVGVVRRREGEGPRAKLSVYFDSHGMKKLVAGYANLQEL